MSRIATWRRGPNDPTTARQWIFRWGGEKIDRSWLVIGCGGRIALLALACGFGTIWHSVMRFAGPIVIAGGALLDAFCKRRGRDSLKEELGPGDAYRVTVSIRDSSGSTTGTDQGTLIYSEGWILFEGERTSFSVTRGESRGAFYEPCLHLTFEDRRTAIFRLVGERPETDAFKRSFYLWDHLSIPEGEAILPPNEIHPEIWADRCSYAFAGLLVGIGGLVVGGLCGVWIVAVGGVLVGGVSLSLAAGYARRLEREIKRVLPPKAPSSLEARDQDGLVTKS